MRPAWCRDIVLKTRRFPRSKDEKWFDDTVVDILHSGNCGDIGALSSCGRNEGAAHYSHYRWRVGHEKDYGDRSYSYGLDGVV